MSRLELITEQTAFLLEKQEEIKKECDALFKDFLGFLDQKLKESDQESDMHKSLQKTYDMISGHAQKLSDDVQDDIEFLREQKFALDELTKLDDPKKANELLGSLIAEEEELPPMDVFKEEVTQDSLESRRSLLTVIDDIKESLNEGDIKSVELLLETMVAEQEDAEGAMADEEGEVFDELPEELSMDALKSQDAGGGCCGSGACSSGGCGSCPVAGSCGSADTEGSDLFSFVSNYDRELANDTAEEEDKKNHKQDQQEH